MNSIPRRIQVLIVTVLWMSISACSQHHTDTVIMPSTTPLNCNEIIDAELEGVSDANMSELLDQAIAEGEEETCWEPLITIALDNDRDIPRKHMVLAIKKFNNRGQQQLFQDVTIAYLNKIADSGTFTQYDHQLLEAFSSMVINSAGTSNDLILRQTQSVCNRLDPQLYTKIFE